MMMKCVRGAAGAVAAAVLLVGMATDARASGTEINGVIAAQPVAVGDSMNPAFVGTVDINVHAPSTLTASTGLMVVVHGLGGNYHQYDTECAFWVNDLDVYTVQINFRNTGAPNNSLVDFGKYQAVDVLRAVQYMLANYAIDKTRVILWGVSGGGLVALNAARMAPDVFSMLAVLAPVTRPTNELDRTGNNYEADPPGGWERYALGNTTNTYTVEEWDIRDAQYGAAFLTLPVYILHGSLDPVVDIQHSLDLQLAILAAGGSVTMTTITGGDHAFGGADTTEDTRFKATQKYLRSTMLSAAGVTTSVMDVQGKRVFPTRGTKAWPVKFDEVGVPTLDQIESPGVVANLWLTQKTVQQGNNLNFDFAFTNWTTSAAVTTLLVAFVDLSNGAVIPIVGPAPLAVPVNGIQGAIGLPVAFAPGNYLLAVAVLGNTPSPYIDLDFVKFTVTL